MGKVEIENRTLRVNAPATLVLADLSTAVAFNTILATSLKTLFLGLHSEGILTLSAGPDDTETVTIDGKVYTFQTTLTDVDGNVLIGGTPEGSIDNLVAAITLTGTAGTQYAASMTLHSTVTAEKRTSTTMAAIAKTYGPEGDAIATTEDITTGGSWDGATFGAVDATNVITVEHSPDGTNWFYDQLITFDSGAIATAEIITNINNSMANIRLTGTTPARMTAILHGTV